MGKYVIIGNGVAGTTGAEHIRKQDSDGTITLITDEPYPFYSRIRLIDYLAGEATLDDITLKKGTWYEENRVNLLMNTRVIQIDPHHKKIVTHREETVTYDKLLLATGADPFVPGIPGAQKKGVFTLRRFQDAQAIRGYARGEGHHVLLIGGGVLGLEAGNSLRKTGCRVTVVEFSPRLLPRQMDSPGAEILQAQMETMGFTFYLGAKTQEITGDTTVDGVLLQDGTRIPCDMVLISAGIRPCVTLAENLGLHRDRGILVNNRMETSLPDIYAAGDTIQHRNIVYGIWPAAEKQGEVAGVNMTGGTMTYEGTVISNTLKVAGIDLVSAGNIDPEGHQTSIVKRDKDAFVYKKLVLEQDRITGAILYGDTTGRTKILRAIQTQKDIRDITPELEQWHLENL